MNCYRKKNKAYNIVYSIYKNNNNKKIKSIRLFGKLVAFLTTVKQTHLNKFSCFFFQTHIGIGSERLIKYYILHNLIIL